MLYDLYDFSKSVSSDINATGIIANEKIFRQRRPFKQNIIYGKKYQYKY